MAEATRDATRQQTQQPHVREIQREILKKAKRTLITLRVRVLRVLQFYSSGWKRNFPGETATPLRGNHPIQPPPPFIQRKGGGMGDRHTHGSDRLHTRSRREERALAQVLFNSTAKQKPRKHGIDCHLLTH
jgi:hypothetical protein